MLRTRASSTFRIFTFHGMIANMLNKYIEVNKEFSFFCRVSMELYHIRTIYINFVVRNNLVQTVEVHDINNFIALKICGAINCYQIVEIFCSHAIQHFSLFTINRE